MSAPCSEWEVVGSEQLASVNVAHLMLRWLGSLQASMAEVRLCMSCV